MSDLVEHIVKAHGGLDRWRAVRSLEAKVSMGGLLYRLKGYPEGLPGVTMTIDTRNPALTIAPYAKLNARGHYTPDRVWIEDDAGRVIEERKNPRDSFVGHVLETPWDQLHRLYFTGYAMSNYFRTPFLFTGPGFDLQELDPQQENGETLRRLRVMFPRHIPTHDGTLCGGSEREEQILFFNDKGLLQRHDYDAIGPASHYCFDHTTFGGLVFPTLRRVVLRSPTGPMVFGPTAALVQIADVAVK